MKIRDANNLMRTNKLTFSVTCNRTYFLWDYMAKQQTFNTFVYISISRELLGRFMKIQ